jgi:uncharacterized protein (TIGR03437 family)
MKSIFAFFIAVAASFAQTDFTTGQAPRLVIGQPAGFTAANPNSSNTTIGAASGVAYAADTLFIADDNYMGATPENNRVLIIPNLSGALPPPTAQLQYNTICPICVGTASVVLGQPDFVTTTENLYATQNNMRAPTAVASDGIHLVVADTNHNRVQIWNHIPTTSNQAADVVLGQANFTSSVVPTNGTPSASSLSGPEGVWILNGKLYVADTQNNRVLIWNQIPTANGAPANVVLGQPNFTTFVEVNILAQTTSASATNMLNPTSVTSDGTRLFVTDLGFNRVLIWNHIPTTNDVPADVEIGQPDMNSSVPNNGFSQTTTTTNGVTTVNPEVPVLCTVSNGTQTLSSTDSTLYPTYPSICNYTLNYPRFALSDGKRLFIADGGNDRVLEYLTIPTHNAPAADTIIGQVGGQVDQATDAADSMNTPSSLAFDGVNLYVADPYNRRITVYTVAPNILPYQAVVNTYNQNVYATGTITIGGSINNGDVISVNIGNSNAVYYGGTSNTYTYTVKATDTFPSIVTALADAINSNQGDPNVIAVGDTADSEVVLQARVAGPQGGSVSYATALSANAQVTATASDSILDGGGNAASVAPGTIVTINGTNLAAQAVSANLNQTQLPTTLGGVNVYFNGIPAPLLFVSPTQINAQMPWEFTNTTSVNAFVVSNINGTTTFTSAVASTIVTANPSLAGVLGTSNPEIGFAYHYSSHATAIVSVDGSANAGDVATVTVRDRSYSYTVQATDTLDSIRDALVAQIQQDPEVTASVAGVFDRIIISALVAGPDGNGIPILATASSGADVTMTAFDSQTGAANIAGAPLTQNNPAQAGELVILYATGMGLPVLTSANQPYIVTGMQYPVGGPITAPQQFANAIAGGSTADVIQSTVLPGSTGLFQVVLHLSPGLASNPNTEVTVAQGAFVSNPVAIPVVAQ